MSDFACWGTLGIYRDPGEPDFSDEEAAFLAEIASTLAEGFRRALLISSITTEENPDGPGLLLLDEEDNVTSIAAAAERWLEELIDLGDPTDGRLPLAVTAVGTAPRGWITHLTLLAPQRGRGPTRAAEGGLSCMAPGSAEQPRARKL